MHIFHREAKDCEPGRQWYTCTSNQYRGCCSVDACSPNGCPDYSPSIKVLTTIAIPIQNKESTPLPSTIATSSTASKTSKSPSVSLSALPRSAARPRQVTSPSSAAVTALKTSLQVERRPTEPDVSGSSSLETPIIVGSVAGVVILAVIAVLLWLFLQRRRSKQLSTSGQTGNFARLEEEQRPRPKDVFATSGGYERSPSMQERSISTSPSSSQQTAIDITSTQPLYIVADDACLPDVEKSSIAAPPLIDHPALHLLPGEHPAIPAYHPGRVIAFPELAQHPAHLARHPSLVFKQLSNDESTSASLCGYPKRHTMFSSQKSRTTSQNAKSIANNSISILPSQRYNNQRSDSAVLPRIYIRASVSPQDSAGREISEQKISATNTKGHRNLVSSVQTRSELPGMVSQDPSERLSKHDLRMKPHVSQMLLPSNLAITSKMYPSPPEGRCLMPPQRPRIDTAIATKHSRSPLVRVNGDNKSKGNLGKGNEHVMSWATYNNSTSSFSQRSRREAEQELSSSTAYSEVEVWEESPILPNLHPLLLTSKNSSTQRFCYDSEYSKTSPIHSERWSGSTALLSVPSSLDVSPSCYSQDVDGNRYSGVDFDIERELLELSAAQRESVRCERDRNRGNLTPLEQLYNEDWVKMEHWPALTLSNHA